jgi:hypothetical protein
MPAVIAWPGKGTDHRKYIRIDIMTLERGHGRVCLADGNSE